MRPGETPLLVRAVLEEIGAHHRGKRERDEAGDRHGARKRQGELAEERAGQAALEGDRGVDGCQRDGHGDDRADQFARAENRGIHRCAAGADVPLDVFDDDDGVVHHDPDRQHDGEQREQVDREAERDHQRERTDQRQRHGHDRDQHGAERAHEQKITTMTMSSVSSSVVRISCSASLMYFVPS